MDRRSVIRRYTHQNGGSRLRLNPPCALTFHYPPYAVGPYAEGDYVAFVPWETLQPYLTPEGTKIFGGARPMGDDDGTP